VLKKAIKEEMKVAFDHIDANSLDVWKVSVPSDRNLKANLDNLRSSLVVDDGSPHVPTQPPNEELRSLLPLRTLLEIFPQPPTEKHVHIIIQPPTRSVRSQDDLEEKEDIIAVLRTSAFLTLIRLVIRSYIFQGMKRLSRKAGMQRPRQRLLSRNNT
jgi:Crinkler effector protein N-terminal domain